MMPLSVLELPIRIMADLARSENGGEEVMSSYPPLLQQASSGKHVVFK